MTRFLFLLLVLMSLALVACDSEDEESDTDDSAELTANAGEDFMVTVGDAPIFDACESTGDIDNFKWTILSAPEPVADDAGKVIREVETNCSFTLEDAMVLEEAGEWVIELEVQSGDDTETDTVTITVMASEDTPSEDPTDAPTEEATQESSDAATAEPTEEPTARIAG